MSHCLHPSGHHLSCLMIYIPLHGICRCLMIYIPPHIICRCLMIYTPLNILRGVIHIPLYSVRLFLCTLCFSASWTTSLNTVSVSSAAQYSSVPHYLHPSIQYPLVFLCTEFVSAPLSASLNTVSFGLLFVFSLPPQPLQIIRWCIHLICLSVLLRE